MTVIKLRAALLALVVGLAVVATACGSDKGPGEQASTSSDEATTTTSEASGDSSDTTLPPGAQAGFDDYNGDGTPEPLCGTKDYGAGLVLRQWCDQEQQAGYSPEAPEGVILVKDSLFKLPGPPGGGELPGFEGMSGSTLQARNVDGNKVIVVTFNSGALFETGSTLTDSESLDAVIRGVNQHYAGGRVQVRGHTDTTGSAAGNQTLSEQRAQTVKDYLQSHGMKATSFASVGVGSSLPLAEERKPDGSVSEEGQKFNRRVEIVVTVPKA